MSLGSRISTMERSLGLYSDGGICHCQYCGFGVVYWPDGSRTDHGPCERCGKVRPAVVVEYDPPGSAEVNSFGGEL
jgi:hypothetical protein